MSGQFKSSQVSSGLLKSGQIKFKTVQVRSGKCQLNGSQEGQIKVSLGQIKPGQGRFRTVHVIVMLCQGQLMSVLIVSGKVRSSHLSSAQCLVRSGQGQVITGQVIPG